MPVNLKKLQSLENSIAFVSSLGPLEFDLMDPADSEVAEFVEDWRDLIRKVTDFEQKWKDKIKLPSRRWDN